MRFVPVLASAPSLAALLVVAGLAVPAQAQETRASAAAKAAREFAQTDTNNDGVLSRAEVQARIIAMSAGTKKIAPVNAKRLTDLFFTGADRDKNGKITLAEYQAQLLATFDRYDTDGDGRVGGARPGQRPAGPAVPSGR